MIALSYIKFMSHWFLSTNSTFFRTFPTTISSIFQYFYSTLTFFSISHLPPGAPSSSTTILLLRLECSWSAGLFSNGFLWRRLRVYTAPRSSEYVDGLDQQNNLPELPNIGGLMDAQNQSSVQNSGIILSLQPL